MKSYQSSHNNYPCVFCLSTGDDVVGHHIQVKGLGGMGMKVHDSLAIPVCYEHHNDCHNGSISQAMQVKKLREYQLDRLAEEIGFAKAIDKLSRSYSVLLLDAKT